MQVRQPGLSAIAELVGEPPTIKRPGPTRKVIAQRREDLRAKDFPPFWREATHDLLTAYHCVCAYACLYIYPITGSATVDHWAPKSKAWDRVYEWSNYRLACSFINAKKGDFSDVIDPTAIDDGIFALDLIAMVAIPGPKAGSRRVAVQETIQRLGLDGSRYTKELDGYYEAYSNGEVSFEYLEKRAPFLARELQRQGKLRAEEILKRPAESPRDMGKSHPG